ncbi:MAG: aldo/keto reductase, partial [Erysipelotrichaceae bacterium]|nr:aldo/keto reductase [Erysipelotrichaceae bacterium]
TSKVWVDAIDAGKVRESFEASLKRLDIGYIDLFLLHWPVSREANIRAWKVLEEIYSEGKVRAIGLSNYKEKHINELLEEAKIIPALDQVELHPDFTQNEIYEFCKEKGIQLGAWSPLGGQKPNSGSLFSDPTLLKLAEKYGKSVAQIIIRWDVQRGIVVIPKSVHKERIKANIEVFDFEISPQDMDLISSLNENNRIDQDPDNFMNYWNSKPEEGKNYTI